MRKLTMNDHIKSGAFANKTVEEVTKIKGAIFSMIKEGYEFDDEVLKAARIRKIIRDEQIDFVVNTNKDNNRSNPLPKETTSLKQILAELNTLDNFGTAKDNSNNYGEDIEDISANNFEESND